MFEQLLLLCHKCIVSVGVSSAGCLCKQCSEPQSYALTIKPENTAAVVGERVSFHCSSDATSINWFHVETKLAEACLLNPAYTGLYSLDQAPGSSVCTLNVLRVDQSLGGVHRCLESTGFEPLSAAHLVVIGKVDQSVLIYTV